MRFMVIYNKSAVEWDFNKENKKLSNMLKGVFAS